MGLSTKFGKEIPFRNLHEKRSGNKGPDTTHKAKSGVPGKPNPKIWERQMGETKREKRQLVEDFRRFLQIWSLICKVGGLEPQKAAENRRKPQEAVSTPFSHLVSPIKRCPKRKADMQAGSRISGVFVNSECFPGKHNENSRKHPKFANCTDFCEFSFCLQEKHSEFTKTPQIREPACESAFSLGLVCRGDP